MSGDSAGRTLTHEKLSAMVGIVRPDWHLRAATLAESGWTALYHLEVDTPTGRRTVVLKAPPADDRPARLDVEARIQAVVDDRTDIPVPTVLGAVDDHDDVRTPYFLMEALPGETIPATEVGTLPDEGLRRIASETGRYLGQLHGVGAGLDAFGEAVDYDRSRKLRGERPPSDLTRLCVPDGDERWPALLRDWFEEDLAALGESRFGDLAPALRAEGMRRLNELPSTFTPVLGRTDHHWNNRLVGRDRDTLAGVLDWGGTSAVPRGFSLAYAEEGLATKLWKARPGFPDRRPLVRDALLAGYAETASVPTTLSAQRECYRLDFLIRDMALFDERAAPASSVIPDAGIEEAAAEYRAVARAELGRDDRYFGTDSHTDRSGSE